MTMGKKTCLTETRIIEYIFTHCLFHERVECSNNQYKLHNCGSRSRVTVSIILYWLFQRKNKSLCGNWQGYDSSYVIFMYDTKHANYYSYILLLRLMKLLFMIGT